MFCETLGSTGLPKIHGWQMPNKNWKTSTHHQACSIFGFCESVVYLALWSFNAVTISCWSCWWELFEFGMIQIQNDFFQNVFSKQKSPGGDIWNGKFTLWRNNLGCFKKPSFLSCLQDLSRLNRFILGTRTSHNTNSVAARISSRVPSGSIDPHLFLSRL